MKTRKPEFPTRNNWFREVTLTIWHVKKTRLLINENVNSGCLWAVQLLAIFIFTSFLTHRLILKSEKGYHNILLNENVYKIVTQNVIPHLLFKNIYAYKNTKITKCKITPFE